MKNLTFRDRQIFCMIIAILLVSAVCVFAIEPLERKAEGLKKSITVLQDEYQERCRVKDEKEEVILKTEMYNKTFSELKEHYPEKVEKEDQISLAVDLERDLGLKILSVQCEEPENIYDLISSEKGENIYSLTESRMTVSAVCSYSEWKQIFPYISSREDPCRVTALSASFDPESEMTEFRITVAQYAIGEKALNDGQETWE